MNTRKMMVFASVMLAAFAVVAAPSRTKKGAKAMAGSDEGPVATGRASKVLVDQMPKIGQACCLSAPQIQGATQIGQCYAKPRKWIVLETKFTTFGTDDSKFLDQLTFTWHVLLDSDSATENKGNKDGLAPYSYFSTTTTYFNIPQGSHAASVVLPPSYVERYGYPKAVGFVITNENGDELGDNTFCVSEVRGIGNGEKFWDNNEVMNATGKDGKPMIERRQGLVDRSKTIWALVNPNDYEATMQ